MGTTLTKSKSSFTSQSTLIKDKCISPTGMGKKSHLSILISLPRTITIYDIQVQIEDPSDDSTSNNCNFPSKIFQHINFFNRLYSRSLYLLCR